MKLTDNLWVMGQDSLKSRIGRRIPKGTTFGFFVLGWLVSSHDPTRFYLSIVKEQRSHEHNMETINIFSTEPVVSQLILRINEKKTKACKHLDLIKPRGYLYFTPICLKKIAVEEENKDILISHQHVSPRHYYWPKCPPNCLLFKKDRRFEKRLLDSYNPRQSKFHLPMQFSLKTHNMPLRTYFETFILGMLFLYLLQKLLPPDLLNAAMDWLLSHI